MASLRSLATALTVMFYAASASAHAFLASAVPGVGSTVRVAPAEVAIRFTEGVEPLFTRIAVTDAAGVRVDSGAVHRVGEAARVAVALKPLAPGGYTVSWHATSVDTHKTEGTFRFTLRP